MESKQLLAQIRKRREKQVDLGDGKKITIIRPPEAEMPSLLKDSPDGTTSFWSVTPEHVRKYTIGWSGITEADLLGESIGASDPVEFDPDLWAEVSSDNVVWGKAAAAGILKAIVDHINSREDVAKN